MKYAWLCLALFACAGRKSAMAPAQAPAAQSGAQPESPRDEITRLSGEIDRARQPAAPNGATPMATQACTDVCSIADTICKNSGRICELADGMAGDDWAAGKCTDAKQACTDAKKRCTDCS